ncbi:hypothetical protein ACEYW6_18800 [Nostoc sp. UIC 10607]|uniref:hypothetical protein n=1 Tax=Nostoc sp. UIC 10607 TaxID=3045935 RepID=UPI00399F8548
MRFSSYEDNQEGQVACGKAAYGFLTTLLLARQSASTSQVIYFTHLMPTVERITKASRIIVRQEGVGLSMLRNVKNGCIKNKYERNNQH